SVNLAVGGIEPQAHQAGVKLKRQSDDSRLRCGGDILRHQIIDPTLAKTTVQKAAGERAKTTVPGPKLGAAGIVKLLRHPDDWLVEGGRRFHCADINAATVGSPMIAVSAAAGEILHVAVEAAAPDDIDLGGRHPVALVVTNREAAIWQDAHAVGNAKAGAINLGLASVWRNFEDGARQFVIGVLAGFGIVEVALRIHLQVKVEAVEKGRNVLVGVKGLIEIGLSVMVEIMESHDAIVARHINQTIYYLRSEGLVKSGSKTGPSGILQRLIQSRDNPDIAGVGCHNGAAVRKEG